MKMWKTKTWQHETTATESNAVLFGTNIFLTDFRSTGETVVYKEKPYDVYTVFINKEEYRFAMTEISNGVYDFLIEKY